MSTATRLVLARSLRGVADGVLAIAVPLHLMHIGFGPREIGAFVAATLLGSALFTLAAGLGARRFAPRSLLLAACVLMGATALGLASATTFLLLLAIGFVGTFNPSAADVSVFLPTEQALLATQDAAGGRAALFARYNLGGSLGAALGALASGVFSDARLALAGYALVAALLAALYAPLRSQLARDHRSEGRAPLARSRRTVLELSALFSLDSFGGGFAVQSILVLWLHRRFELAPATTGAVFSAAALLAAASQLASARLSGRLGLVRTMVFTHIPANLFLAAAALAPSAPLAIAFLLARSALSQMDVPARQALVMALVPAEERAAAASLTNVPRSLASALAPLPAGALLALPGPGWPLLAGAALKLVYDLWFFAAFRAREPLRPG
jgi:MFS family permease